MTAFLEIFLPYFKRHLAYGKFYKCLPVEWDEKEKRIIVINTPWRRTSIHIWTVLQISYIIFQTATLILGKHAYSDIFVGILILGLNCCLCMIRIEFELDFTPVENINRLISGLDSQPHMNPVVLIALKFIFIIPELSYWIVALGSAVMSVLLPCKPPFLGSFVLCQMSGSSLSWKFLVMPPLAILEFGMAMQSFLCGCHYAEFTQILGLALLWGKCQEFTKSKNINDLVKRYRELQIQGKIHNSSFRERILPVSMLTVPLIEVLSGFALVTLYHKASLVQTSLFLMLNVDATLGGMIILTSAASVYVKTTDWINITKSRLGKNSGYFRKVHKSFRPLRLEFGNNFVDRLTPLMLQEFCIRQTATLLLLARA